MPGSAQERADALQPHLDQARQRVAELEAAVGGAEQRAHDHYVKADVPSADAAHAEAAELKRQLEAAQARLQTFHQAAEVVSAQRQREHLEARLVSTNQALAEAAAEAQRQAAEVRPALSAAKMALKRGQAAEDQARRLELERFELEIHLGMRERTRFSANINHVSAMVERYRHLQDLLVNPEL